MAEDTGGVAFFPKDLSEVQAITPQIAHDIRNQYTISYKPTTPQSAGGYRTVKVDARPRATSSFRCARAAAITPARTAIARRWKVPDRNTEVWPGLKSKNPATGRNFIDPRIAKAVF